MPVAQVALGFLQQPLQLFAGVIELRVGLVTVAHALYQQAQAMPVVGRIFQRLRQSTPLLDQAPVDTPLQPLHQPFTVGRTQEQREHVENRQYARKLGATRHAGERTRPALQAALPGLQVAALDELRRQHLAVTQRRGQGTQRLRRALQLLHPRQATQRAHEAAQTPQGDTQVMQCLAVGIGSQPLPAGQQPYLQRQYLDNHMVEHGGHGALLGQRPARDSRI